MAIKAISLYTFQEILRRRTFYFLIFLLFLLVILIPNLPSFNIGVKQQLFLDFSLGFTSLFLAILATALSTNQLPADIERKIIYQILSKPIKRSEVIIGKYLGVLISLFISAVIASLAIFLLNFVHFNRWQPAIFWGVTLGFLEASVLSAFVFLISTLATPTITVLLTITFYFIGHAREQLVELFAWFKFLALLFPSLESFNLSDPLAHGVSIPFSYYGLTFVYGLLFSTFYLLAAILIFNQREL